MSDAAETAVALLHRRHEERDRQKRRRFNQAYAAWLRHRAAGFDFDPDVERSDEETSEYVDRTEKLMRRIVMMPATEGWMIFRKLEVLEDTLAGDGDGTGWSDNREVAMVGAIKADLLRFYPRERS
jgi:hypothetical protein